MSESDYLKYRGKCKEFVMAAIEKNASLIAVRGWYHCPLFGKQEHWWCKTETGEIYDPTVKQFPSGGTGTYEEYKGFCQCEQCGKTISEAEMQMCGPYPVCSGKCAMKLVGL